MRLVIIIILVVACGWLLSERHSLNEKNAALTDQLDRSREKTSELEKKLGQLSPEHARVQAELANTKTSIEEIDQAKKLAEAERARAEAALRQPKESWLKGHVEKGSRALDSPGSATNASPFPARPR